MTALSRSCFPPTLILLASLSTLKSAAPADQWPEILGPDRSGVVPGERIATKWHEGHPRVAWQYPLGEGFAGPAVVGQYVIVFHRTGDAERVEALNRESGKAAWKRDFPASYRGTINPDSGPRCVPLVKQRRVIVFGAAGEAHCVDLETGRPIWNRELFREYGAQEGYFGAGSTPIAVEDVVIFNIGGRNGAGLVGLNIDSGKTVWTATDEDASYSSPIKITIGGENRVFVIARLNALMIDPSNGSMLFRLPFGQRGPTVNAATPIVVDDRLFLTASYGIGAKLIEFSERDYREIWSSDESLSSQYNTPIAHRGNLYGIHGREDVGIAELRCIDSRDGSVKWSKAGFGVANLLLADDKLVCITVDGQLVLVDATASRYVELARCKISPSTTRALPALVSGKLFVRDTQRLMCLDIGK
jgi:outer membrane protein assembly factor BamB